MMDHVLLSGRGLKKTFGSNEVLHGVDIDILAGDFTVIMGSSGSGKSTLLYVLSGMDRLSDGSLSMQSHDMTRLSEKELTRLRAEAFGFVFQNTHLIGNLSLLENILMAGFIQGKMTEKEVLNQANQLIARMNLGGAENRMPSQVSGGEAQRAAVARAVISTPQILFADEPTGALNKANTREVLNLFSELHASGQTILLVTHDREAALRGNRILYLEDGQITSELNLPSWQGPDADREQRLADWLTRQGW